MPDARGIRNYRSLSSLFPFALLGVLGTSCGSIPSVVVTPLQPGVYRGDPVCTTDTVGPDKELLERQTLSAPVVYEISSNGVPIVEGNEVRQDRTVTLGTLRVTYTRVAATATGIVIHATTTDGGVETLSVATLDQQTATSLIYRITLTTLGNNAARVDDCEALLER